MSYLDVLAARAEAVKRGLSLMPPQFLAKLCWSCNGAGEYRQTYNLGCGMGSMKMMGCCDHCAGTGLQVCHKPAPSSVLNQVLEAAERDSARGEQTPSSGTVDTPIPIDPPKTEQPR